MALEQKIEKENVKIDGELLDLVRNYCHTSIPKLTVTSFIEWAVMDKYKEVTHKPTPRGL